MLNYLLASLMLTVISDILGMSFAISVTYISLKVVKYGEKSFATIALGFSFLAMALMTEAVHLFMLIISYLVGEILILDPFTEKFKLCWLLVFIFEIFSYSLITGFYLMRYKKGILVTIFPIILIKTVFPFAILSILVVILLKSNIKEKRTPMGFALLALSHLILIFLGIFDPGYVLLISSIAKLVGLYLLFTVIWKVEV